MPRAAQSQLQHEIRRRMPLAGIPSMRELAKRANLGESAVKEILNGKSQHPRIDTITKIAAALGCSPDELTGAKTSAAADVKRPSSTIIEIGVTASAGGGSLPDSEHAVAEWNFPTEWLRHEIRGQLDGLRVITIEGDSMSPTFEPGDKAIIDLNQRTPSPPGVFALWDGLALVAKRLEYIEGSEPASVRIMSDNRRYETYTRTCDEIRIVGRIRGRWQRL